AGAGRGAVREAVVTTTTREGRNVDPALGILAGEGAPIAVRKPSVPATPDAALEAEPGPTYHGMAALQPPVWKAYIPLYFWCGGGAGGGAPPPARGPPAP